MTGNNEHTPWPRAEPVREARGGEQIGATTPQRTVAVPRLGASDAEPRPPLPKPRLPEPQPHLPEPTARVLPAELPKLSPDYRRVARQVMRRAGRFARGLADRLRGARVPAWLRPCVDTVRGWRGRHPKVALAAFGFVAFSLGFIIG